jgi:DNA polymerase
MRLFFDIETRSAIDLTKVGSWLYARHPTTDIRCVSYCLVVDNMRSPIETWMPGEPVPQAVSTFAANADAEAIAFNNAFDRQIWDQILTPRYGWPAIPFKRHRCAQAAALARALPAKLDNTAAALNIKTRKTKEGMAAMTRLAGPRRQTAKERKAGKPLDFSATPEELATLSEYNRIDVLMMMEVVDRIGLLPPAEHAVWQLDQQINERGVYVDIGLLEAGICIGEEARRELCNEIAELTDGAVTTPKQVPRIRKWLAQHGCRLSSLQKGAVVDALLEPGLNKDVRRLLELRQRGAGAAALKFKTLRRWIDEESEPRIRYTYRYHGGSAGRFTSLGVQLHNLRKPELTNVREAVEAVTTGSPAEMHRRGFAQPLETLGQIVRAAIIAPPGKRLFIADLSGIEARGAAEVVGAVAELEQWRTFDRTGRPEDEPYYRDGIATFGCSPAIARKTGKTGALAFQYGGGIPAYRKITGDHRSSDEEVAARRDLWRSKHSDHVTFWRLALFQAVQAIQHPEQEFTARGVTFRYRLKTGFLEMTLPSKRVLTYPAAELFEDEQYNTTSFTFFDASGSRNGRMYHERKGSGVFGGLLLENITQAICRDIFVEAMPRLEAAGYPIVMHTHDEYVCEVPENFGSLEEFLSIITQPPSWASHLPVAAKARISDRMIEIVEAAPEAERIVVDNVLENALIEDGDDEGESEEDDVIPIKNTTDGSSFSHIWRSKDFDFPCTPTGEEQRDTDGRIYVRVRAPDGDSTFVPEDELVPKPEPKPKLEPVPEPDAPTETTVPKFNGGGGGSDNVAINFTIPPASSPPLGRDNGYPHGESAGPSVGSFGDQYIYRNALGRLHMRVVRTASKNFPTWYWSGGEWASGWPQEVVPYRLPELLAAAPETLVLICEGEKDCDTAVRYGFIATCNPGGAGKWQPELTQYFQSKQRVCIMEDNDVAGAKHTAVVLKALNGVVPTIGVVRFPELPEHGDLTNFFERGGTKAGLLIRIEEALKAGIARPYIARNLDQIMLTEQRWLWRNHLPIGALELTAGLPGIGKGLLHCDLIARTTTGREWPDHLPGSGPKRVIVLTAEDRTEDYRRRCAAADADLSRIEVLESVRRNERNELFLLSEDLDKLEMACNDFGDVGLVTIDPITAFMGHGRGFDSHRATDVRSQLFPLSRLAGQLDIAFALVTHPPKGAASRAVIDNFIGSQAFLAASRASHFCVEELGPEDERGFRRPTGRVLFGSPRMSHSITPPTLAFRKTVVCVGYTADNRPIEAARIVWEPEPVDLTIDEAVAANKPTFVDGRKARAAPVREFLRAALTAVGGFALQKTIVEQGALKGFTLSQLRRALDAIGGEPFRRKSEGKNSPWWWALSGQTPPDAITEDDEI